MPIYLYVKTHRITGLKYLGQTVQNPFEYEGSGKVWTNHIKKHSYNVHTEVIGIFDSKEQLKEAGIFYSHIWNVVESKEWANLIPEEGANCPWNRGKTSESDIRVKNNIKKTSETLRKKGHYNDCGKYLPKLFGDLNHMKKPEHRKRMSELASRRYKIKREDGSWYWGYHPLS